MRYTIIAACILALINQGLQAQDANRFNDEVNALVSASSNTWNPYKPTILFTGSSSIRMWKNVGQLNPDLQILNHGFGGSQASDLIHHLKELVLDFNPLQVFIYEGDNDLVSGKSVKKALTDLKNVVAGIRSQYPGMQIVLISAKPSISRWKFKGKYQRFNRKMELWTQKDAKLNFADVWNPMLQEDGALKPSIFIEDGLHMNSSGYIIWEQVIKPLLSI